MVADKQLEIKDIQIKDKELLSRAFRAFDASVKKLRAYQAKLENRVEELKTELDQKNRELTNVLQSLSNGLIVTDLDGVVGTFNRAAAAITGIQKEHAVGQPINRLLRFSVLPDPLDDGAVETVGADYRRTFDFTNINGERRILSSSTTIMESEENERQGIIINLNDITTLKRLEEEAERKNRLTAMGEIAMQVAHEIRNPLGSIELFVSMMKKDFTVESNEMELMRHVSSAVQSINHIISNLLEYTRPKPIVPDNTDISLLLAEFVEFSRFFAAQQNIEIDFEPVGETYRIKGNDQLIKQVFHNLFINACQAMPEGGVLKIEMRNVEESDPVVLEQLKNNFVREKKSVPLVKIRFIDSGEGIAEEIKKKIFDPFFTTREQGTGLGMSIVHKTMRAHGGTILVQSEEGKGTGITLLFPRDSN